MSNSYLQTLFFLLMRENTSNIISMFIIANQMTWSASKKRYNMADTSPSTQYFVLLSLFFKNFMPLKGAVRALMHTCALIIAHSCVDMQM